MKILDDEEKELKSLGSRANKPPEDPVASSLKTLSRAIDGLKNAPPPSIQIQEPPREANAEAMAVLNNISTQLQQIASLLSKKPAPSKWSFSVVRNQNGSIASVEATKK